MLPEAASLAAAAARVPADGGDAGSFAVVTILVGVRDEAFDELLAAQDLVVVVVAADAAADLGELAVSALAALAPKADVWSVALPSRLGAPARRAAVARALEALR